ncbi:MAG: glycosyltransferase family 2 protein, partial [Deltaproteobacteria bacterium]|nr:glycosyltransferase family 2 protein [Deltaproteobacteria bacterium]
ISKIDKKVDLAWGLIDALPGHNFLYKLVKIDKFISHIIIRPLLWKFNICISLPGQIFFINKSKFLRDLPIYDTLFDDLTIGIVAKKNKYLSNYFKLYLGYEKPSTSFYLLLKQRLRWSKGFYQAIINNLHNGMLIYILIHGFMYHFLWAPLLILFIIFFKISSIVALFSLILLCLFLSNMKSYLFIYSISYCFIFPIIHLVWFFSLLKYIIFKKNK